MKKPLALTAVVFLALTSAKGDLVYGNLGPSGTGTLGTSGFQVTSPNYLAQAFTTPTAGDLLSLQSITLGLSINTGTSGATLSLSADSSGVPGTVLATASVTVSAGIASLYTFTFSNPVNLANNSTYWIVPADPDGGSSYNWVFNDDALAPTAQNSSGYAYPANGTLRSTNGGTTWDLRLQDNDAAFYINATAVPEPGTWAAAAVLAGGAGLMGWRRRKAAK